MLTIKDFIRIVVILFLEVDIFYANSRTCYKVYTKTICYFQPIPANTRMTWDDAWTVCKENNSTLPVIENRMMEETLRKYLESKTMLRSEAWLAGRENRTTVWQWLGGKLFGLQSISKGYALLNYTYETNAVMNGFQFEPRYPSRPKYYICHFTDIELCQNKTVVHLKNGCLLVNNEEALNLVDARNMCFNEGGDLATFEEDEDLRIMNETNSTLLQNSKEYWIGLRQNWWIWNETDTYKEIKYSNWLKYENLLNKQCLYMYIRLNDYKWNQDQCTREKPFLCQSVVSTTSQTEGADDTNNFSPTLSPEDMNSFTKGTLLAIIGAVIAVFVVAVIIVALVVLRKIPRNTGVNRDEKPTEPHEMSIRPTEKKSVKSKTIEMDDMSNHYAEIPRVVDHDDNDECRDETQLGTLYAALEFDANKEPVMCSLQEKEVATAPTKVGASNENGQRGSSTGSPIQAAEGTIYANL